MEALEASSEAILRARINVDTHDIHGTRARPPLSKFAIVSHDIIRRPGHFDLRICLDGCGDVLPGCDKLARGAVTCTICGVEVHLVGEAQPNLRNAGVVEFSQGCRDLGCDLRRHF